MGGNKKPRKKTKKSTQDLDKASLKEANSRGKNLIYIIIGMSIIGAGVILYFV